MLTTTAPAGAVAGPDSAVALPQILAGGVVGAVTGVDGGRGRLAPAAAAPPANRRR